MCFECRVLGALAPLALPRPDPGAPPPLTAYASADFTPTPAQLSAHLVDAAAEAYLAPALARFSALRPTPVTLRALSVDSDGSCLPYALSRCLVGKEILYDLLRVHLHHELSAHYDFYAERFSQSMDAETYAAHHAELLREALPTHGQRTGRWLGPGEQLCAMANVLARPVLLLDADMSSSLTCGLFLPLRLSREQVAQAHPRCFPSPLVIGWSSAARNHFVALVRVAGPAPDALRALFPSLPAFPPASILVDVKVPANHVAGGACFLRDADSGADVRVEVPAHLKPLDVFQAALPRALPPLLQALATLLRSNGQLALLRGLRTLDLVLSNLADAAFSGSAARMAKTQRLALANPLVYSSVASVPGALDLLLALGFRPQPGGSELVFQGVVDAEFVRARDVLRALRVADLEAGRVELGLLPEGQVGAGAEPDVFGPSPAAGALSWEQARELYASDGPEAGKRAADSRRASGAWVFASGRCLECKSEVDAAVAALRGVFADLSRPTDIGAVDWDDEEAYDAKLAGIECAGCGFRQLWRGQVDGPGAERHEQACERCAGALRPEWAGARKILHFTGQALLAGPEAEFGAAGVCPRCGAWMLAGLGCGKCA